MKSRAYQTTPTPVLDLLPSLLTTKTNRPQVSARRRCAPHLSMKNGSLGPRSLSHVHLVYRGVSSFSVQ